MRTICFAHTSALHVHDSCTCLLQLGQSHPSHGSNSIVALFTVHPQLFKSRLSDPSIICNIKFYRPHPYLQKPRRSWWLQNFADNTEHQKGIEYWREAGYLWAHSYRYILYRMLQKWMIDKSCTNLIQKMANMSMKNIRMIEEWWIAEARWSGVFFGLGERVSKSPGQCFEVGFCF